MDLVVASETAEFAVAVLKNPRYKVVRHADVQHSRLAGEDVNVIAMLHNLMLGKIVGRVGELHHMTDNRSLHAG